MCNTSCSSVIIYLCKSTVSRIQRDNLKRSPQLALEKHLPVVKLTDEKVARTPQTYSSWQHKNNSYPRSRTWRNNPEVNKATANTGWVAQTIEKGHFYADQSGLLFECFDQSYTTKSKIGTPQGCATHMYVSLAIQKHSIPYVLPN